MLRRDFVRSAASRSLAPHWLLGQQNGTPQPPPAAPVPWTLGLNAKTPLPHTRVADDVSEGDQKFFSAAQMATLTRLADVMLPPLGGQPGAVQAETPLFLDFLIGNSPAPRKKVYTGGLDWLELESQKKYRKAFAKLDDAEADAVLTPWLRTWMSDHPPTELHADFVNIAHADIRAATENSKAWSDAAAIAKAAGENGLYWFPIDPEIYANQMNASHVPPHVQAAPKAAHSIPSYPR